MPKKPELVLTVKRILQNGLDIDIALPPPRSAPASLPPPLPPYGSRVGALPKTIYPRCVSTKPVSRQRPIYSLIQISDDLKSARLELREATHPIRAPSPTDNIRRKPVKKPGKKPVR